MPGAKPSKSINVVLGTVGMVVSVVLVVYMVRRYDLAEVASLLATAGPQWWGSLVVIYLLSFVLRAVRWWLMLRGQEGRAHLGAIWQSIVLGFAGNNVIPARGGELVRMEFFHRATSTSRPTVIGSILLEKIFDGLVLVFLLLVGMALALGQLQEAPWLPGLLALVTGGFVGVLVVLVLLHWQEPAVAQWQPQSRLLAKVQQVLLQVAGALRFLRSARTVAAVSLLSAGIWLFEGAMFCLALVALGVDVDPVAAGLMTLALVNFGVLLPSSPGYVGVFERVSVAALALFAVEAELALTVGVLVHVCQFFPITLLGAGVFFATGLRKMAAKR